MDFGLGCLVFFDNIDFASLKKQAAKITQKNQANQNQIRELEIQIANLHQKLQTNQWDRIKTDMEREENSSSLAEGNYWDKQIQNLDNDKLSADKKQIVLQTRRRNHYTQVS